MSDTQALLGKIAALRQRLEQARGLVEDAGSAAAALLERGPDPMTVLQHKVAAGSRQGELLPAPCCSCRGPPSRRARTTRCPPT
jgi:hypothetical protein